MGHFSAVQHGFAYALREKSPFELKTRVQGAAVEQIVSLKVRSDRCIDLPAFLGVPLLQPSAEGRILRATFELGIDKAPVELLAIQVPHGLVPLQQHIPARSVGRSTPAAGGSNGA